MESDYINDLEELDIGNFWFKAKEKYLNYIIKEPGAIILDIGCGSGRCLSSFTARGFEVIGIDISERAVTLCKEKGYRAFQADLEKETVLDMQSAPDYITALDFMEHVENSVQVLRNLRKLSNSGTQLIVTVPSYQGLFSEWDQAMGHVKRYSRTILSNELKEGGWEVYRITYIHLVPLIPALLVRKIFKPFMRKISQKNASEKEKFINPHFVVNWLLYFMYYPEFFLFWSCIPLPVGLSILAIATPKRCAA